MAWAQFADVNGPMSKFKQTRTVGQVRDPTPHPDIEIDSEFDVVQTPTETDQQTSKTSSKKTHVFDASKKEVAKASIMRKQSMAVGQANRDPTPAPEAEPETEYFESEEDKSSSA